MRAALFSASVIAMAVDGGAVTGGGEGLIYEALKQGGLLVVVLLLLYGYRRDVLRREGEKDAQLEVLTQLVTEAKLAMAANAESATAKQQQINSLMELVAKSNVAITVSSEAARKSAEATIEQAHAMADMTRVIAEMKTLIAGRRVGAGS